MCGIAGFCYSSTIGEDQLRSIAANMAEALRHRGPDSQGHWINTESQIGLAHSRLSVIDVSDAGKQPMVSAIKKMTIVYNGEVYNADEIRQELRQEMALNAPILRGHSDTEVILEACCHWGVEKTVGKLIGMFAMAVWNEVDTTLTIVRDRLGIKPLYWGYVGRSFVFSSELKALNMVPNWQLSVNPDSLNSYLRTGCVVSSKSIINGINRLPAGHLIELKRGSEPDIRQYWALDKVASDACANVKTDDELALLNQLEALLNDSVSRRMVSDVPFGAFLSGGIDSSLVVALMCKSATSRVKTFSIGIDHGGHNESEFAATVAAHLGTEHTELIVSAKNAQEILPIMPQIYDEPFADSSQIPTYLVSQLARDQVTVCLSGDGGDELFAGYNRYVWGNRINHQRARFHPFVRKLLASVLSSPSTDQWDKLASFVPNQWRIPQLGRKIEKVSNGLAAQDELSLYRQFISTWHNPELLTGHTGENCDILWDMPSVLKKLPFVEQMQVLDGLTYLCDDVLTKLDRASMAASLEARVPLLDHRIVEFAFGLPQNMKIRNGKGKWALRELLARHVPRDMFERPKSGFAVPIGDWLRTDLREWAEDLLQPAKLEQAGVLNTKLVDETWRQHINKTHNHDSKLWTILMWQAWHQHWIK